MTDIAVADAGERIGIEVDGPHHFTRNTRALLGQAVARQRLLEARGWSLIRVPYFWWYCTNDKGRAAGLQEVRHEAM